jgi:hypothetical protein
MKKLIRFILIGGWILMLTVSYATAQTNQIDTVPGKVIPPDVMKIIDKSCVNCHAEPGKTLALTHINFSKWDQYSPDKQASKANAMCKELTKGKMPPKKFREANADAIPTNDEIKIICDWAQSLQPAKQ